MPAAPHEIAPQGPGRIRLAWASAVLATVAFAVDVRFGGVVAGELLYVLPPLLGFWSSSRRHAWFAGAIVTTLAAAALVVRGDASGPALVDRVLCLVAVWTTVALCLAHERDVRAIRRAEQSLAGQAALTRLGEMSLMVAHEVKNPLAGLRGAIQVLGERLSTDPSVRPIVDRAFSSIDGLTALVDDLVVFARPGLPRRGSLEMLSLLREVATSLEKDPKLAGGRVSVSGVGAIVSGDARLLRQAFLNLVINAVEAGGPAGQVRVRVSRAGAGCSVEVADDGPGIPAEKREAIFEPFYSTKAHGSGLGLAIARRVVGLHGGEIRVESPTQGGTTMTVTLP